jgi:hypothetical protein
MKEKDELLPADITGLTDGIVEQVSLRRRLFPDVVTELAERQVLLNPSLDRLEAMRSLRDELNARIGQCMLTGSEMVE